MKKNLSRREALKLAGFGLIGGSSFTQLALANLTAPAVTQTGSLHDIHASALVAIIHPYNNNPIANKAIEVDANILDPGKFVQVWDVNVQTPINRQMHQRWLFLPCLANGDNVFYIYNIGSKKYLSTLSALDHDHKLLVVAGIPADNFQFEAILDPDGGVRLAQGATHGAAGYSYTGLENGSAVHFGRLPNPQPKKFTIGGAIQTLPSMMRVGTAVTISPQHDRGRCFDLPGGTSASDTQITTWDHTANNPNQPFQLEHVGTEVPGNFRIKSLKSGLYLQPQGNGTNNGDAIVQVPLNVNNKRQIWNLYGIDDGSELVHIINIYSGMALEIKDWKRQNGALLQQFMLHGGDNQRFQISNI